MEGQILQGNPVHSDIGYSTMTEAKFECSKGKKLFHTHYLKFVTLIIELQNISNILFCYLGRACSGITFESDTRRWTPKRGTDLIVSANPEDKSILRSCYGKKILEIDMLHGK